jgi:Cdc6-like AAA superfamily ATPase
LILNNNLGLKRNPFSKRSSEQELEFLEDIFYEPNYYKTLTNDLSTGDSRFIIGQRGHGKTSIINKLVEDLEKETDLFVVMIDRFDSIPIKTNETAFLILILKTLVTKLSVFLQKNKQLLKSLNQVDKEKLAVFIRLFFSSMSREEFDNIYNNIHKVKTKNRFIKFFNKWGLVPANTITSTAISISSNFVKQSLGLDNIDSPNVYKEYFGTIKEINYDKIHIKSQDCSKENLKKMMDEVLQIIKKLNFKSTIVLFDKIDEYQELNQDIEKIGTFTSELLTDTELLLNANLAIGFSLWSELRSELSGTVRFDKFGFIDVRWKSKDLKPLIDKRVNYFSLDGNKVLDDLFPDENDRNELIKLANKSPRDLISLLGSIYQEQANNNQNVSYFDDHSISSGMVSFCSNYDYDSLYPWKAGRNKEIKAMINRILAVKLNRFTSRDLTRAFNQNNSQSEGQIKLMKSYKLIREDDILGPNSVKIYEVIDPKVEFLVRRLIPKIE